MARRLAPPAYAKIGRETPVVTWPMKARYDLSKARRGAVVPAAPTKTRITIRLDKGILAWFRNQVNAAGGGDYQSLINEALRVYIGQGTEVPLEETLRRVIREEMQRIG
ncbi:MAG: BrnA antitoxin family protein [Acidiferrobacter sp.]